MLAYLILGIALVIGIILIAKGFAGADPATLAKILKWGGAVIAVVLILYFAIIGRLGLALMMGAAAVPIFMRWHTFNRMAKSWRGPSQGQTSEIETQFLRMSLDHDTGDLQGVVLDGRMTGRLVEELNVNELIALLQECWSAGDEQSASILESYLDRTQGADWREREGADAGEGGGGGGSGPYRPGRISRDEALDILGLEPGAGPDEIKEAHRRLMQKVHPDHGGSTFLAAKINEAKDMLLGA